MNLLNWYKKTVSEIKKEDNWESVPYLQGIIMSFLTSIEKLQKENDDLRNNKGIWLSPESIKDLENKLQEIKEKLND